MSSEERSIAGLWESDSEFWKVFPLDFPDSYPFVVGDDPSNISLEHRHGKTYLVGGTLLKLVERLTLPTAPPEMLRCSFRTVFLHLTA